MTSRKILIAAAAAAAGSAAAWFVYTKLQAPSQSLDAAVLAQLPNGTKLTEAEITALGAANASMAGKMEAMRPVLAKYGQSTTLEALQVAATQFDDVVDLEEHLVAAGLKPVPTASTDTLSDRQRLEEFEKKVAGSLVIVTSSN
jgi:hypothetical protein